VSREKEAKYKTLTLKVRGTAIDGMKLSSLALAPLTGKIIKSASMILKDEKICYKMVYYTLYFGSDKVRIYINQKPIF